VLFPRARHPVSAAYLETTRS